MAGQSAVVRATQRRHGWRYGGIIAAAAENARLENLIQNVNFSAKVGRKVCALCCGKISTLFESAPIIFHEWNGNSCKGK
ncbi:hypothetical protein [Janthinobacterium sp. MDT1-19]|uniref:hypothetical protein n=1 Tax=Janthinobacterium sp. MDT1-19 TaxID=1259339 RepID=UPI003F2759C3